MRFGMVVVSVLGMAGITCGITFKQLGPGGGGTAGCLAFDPRDPNIVYVGLDCGGMHVTLNGGEAWKNANTGIDFEYDIACNNHYGLLVLPSGRVLATTDANKIFLSDNHGQSWQKVFDGPCGLGFLLQDPHDPNTVYATTGRGLWNRGRPLREISGKATGSSGSIFVSRKSGEAGSWEKLNTDAQKNIPADATFYTIAVDYTDGKLMYAATDYGMYRSMDGGKSWETVQYLLKRGVGKQVITVRDKPGVVYTSLGELTGDVKDMESGVYRSLDRGETWKPMCNGLPRNMSFSTLAADPADSNVLYLGSADWCGGLYRSMDGGANWKLLFDTNTLLNSKDPKKERNSTWHPEGYHANVGMVIAVGGGDKNMDGLSDVIYFLGDNVGIIWKSVDGGKDWQQITSRLKRIGDRSFWMGRGEIEFLCARNIVVHPKDPKHLWAVDFDWGQHESLDGGISWALVGGPWYEGELIGVSSNLLLDPDQPHIVYCNAGGGVLQGWGSGGFHVIGGRCKQKGGFPNTGVADIGLAKWKENGKDQKYLYATADGHGVYRLNIGQNATQWELVSAGLDDKVPVGICNIPGTPKFFLGTSTGMFKTDDGKTWKRIAGEKTPYTDIRNPKGLAVDPRNPNRVYASIMKNFQLVPTDGLYFSDDGGDHWAKAADVPIPYGIALDTVVPEPTIYVASQSHGVFKVTQDLKTKKWKTEPFADKSNGLVNLRCWTVTVDPHNHRRIYVGTHGSFVFKGE